MENVVGRWSALVELGLVGKLALLLGLGSVDGNREWDCLLVAFWYFSSFP